MTRDELTEMLHNLRNANFDQGYAFLRIVDETGEDQDIYRDMFGRAVERSRKLTKAILDGMFPQS